MKIRNGFVSNSSSSSFIVQVKLSGWGKIAKDEDDELSSMIIDEKSVPLLEEYGFEKTSRSSPISFKDRRVVEEEEPFMHFSVSCNEEDVMAFLMKNNIPFKASCHYDNYYILFKKDSDTYLYAKNFGNEIDMYGFDGKVWNWQQVCRTPKVEERSVRQFLIENKIYLEYLEEQEKDED